MPLLLRPWSRIRGPGVKERPILFSGEMVRAILDGRKTQTRRAVKGRKIPCDKGHDPDLPDQRFMSVVQGGRWGFGAFGATEREALEKCIHYGGCPYGKPRDRLWVRETWMNSGRMDPRVFYRADPESGRLGERYQWKPSIHMKRVDSRITLEVTGVRVERVQEISPEDAIAEGAMHPEASPAGLSARRVFGELWNSINAKRGFGWDVNPWVWVVEFKRIDP